MSVGMRRPAWSPRAPIHGPSTITTTIATLMVSASARSALVPLSDTQSGSPAALSLSHSAKKSEPTPRAKMVLARS